MFAAPFLLLESSFLVVSNPVSDQFSVSLIKAHKHCFIAPIINTENFEGLWHCYISILLRLTFHPLKTSLTWSITMIHATALFSCADISMFYTHQEIPFFTKQHACPIASSYSVGLISQSHDVSKQLIDELEKPSSILYIFKHEWHSYRPKVVALNLIRLTNSC